VTAWPDEIPVRASLYSIRFTDGGEADFMNYSANVERTMFAVRERADIVLACEIIEHLTRAPHVMMLNINSWLKPGGRVILTTPNGAQLDNPLRVKAKMPALRYSSYSRHNFLFTLDTLTDLVKTCGFAIERAEYWSPYRRSGASNLHKLLMRLPHRYFRDKFAQTIVVVARKVEDRNQASRLPKAYEPSPHWEHMVHSRPVAQAVRAAEPDAVE
jgi:SAM-dependent methyltransferase